jgi:hypothetical protein
MASIVINYCSNEKAFIRSLLKQCNLFSKDVVVSYGSHMYDGTPENQEHIATLRLEHPDIKFVEYVVDTSLDLSKQRGVRHRPTAYWHNLARWTGIQALKNKGWVFIIDADEIPDGNLVKQWLERRLQYLKTSECYKVATYWYFKSPIFRSMTLEDSILLIHYNSLSEENIFGDFERDYLIPSSGCILRRNTRGLNGAVMWHHYSWVRDRPQLIHKIKNWAHSNDIFKGADAEHIVAQIFKDDKPNDIVHGYSYTTVENMFGIAL